MTEGDAGYFGPQSVTWRVHADPMMLVGGVRALFLQALHPRAMLAVSRHSTFRDEPWRRLLRTAKYIGVTTYGTKAEADDAAARVRRVHASIPDADNPELLRWIHCCEVDSFLEAARRGGLPLTDVDADRYVAEQATSASFVGLPGDAVPADMTALRAYFAAMRPELALTPAAKEAARYLLIPPMSGWVQALTPARGAWAGLVGLSFALLPGWARRLYHLPGLPTSDLAASAAARAMRTSLMLLPDQVRTGPALRAARERLAS